MTGRKRGTPRIAIQPGTDPSKWRKPTLGLHSQPIFADGKVDVRALVAQLDERANRGAGEIRP